ncbi:hypothetical protein [Seonamhaeicola sp.]|uniref:hypothetical protein n=1 Tax=Seonamhaeicola sp. TaxID=1912245 RepID=UPI00262F967C|nr:hypothetical protein [Seonamhaeicola sp.]
MEILVRMFHLYNDVPLLLFIDEYDIQKTEPGQRGFSVTGNRRQNFAEFNINSFGYNSYREFTPSADKIEVALIGDSYIEGFNQHYYDSTGKKIEVILNNEVEVYEYGRGGYDMADQLHIINSYKEQFELIDYIFIYMKFKNDLRRTKIKPDHDLVNLKHTFKFQIKRYIRVLKYANAIGLFDGFRDIRSRLTQGNHNYKAPEVDKKKLELKYMENFKSLVKTYGFDKEKTIFLFDKRKTNKLFLDHCDEMGYKYLDFGESFEKATRPTDLIYDRHWNNLGRTLVATVIANYVKEQEALKGK